MNVSLSSLERLLHRYTMESTAKPFDVRSVPIETTPVEPAKGEIGRGNNRDRRLSLAAANAEMGSTRGATTGTVQVENTYNGTVDADDRRRTMCHLSV